MYKIVFIDLDGTLLNSKKEISEFDVNILKQLSINDIKIVFASARGFYRILPYIKNINNENEFNYTLAFNGSLIINNTQTKKIFDNCVTQENFNKLKKWIKKQNIDNVWVYCYKNKYKLNEFNSNEPVYKIVVLDSEEGVCDKRGKIDKEIKNCFEITSSEPTRIEFVQKGITKEEAVKQLLSYLKIDPRDMIAIGDGDNDVDMIKIAGYGIAMGNACSQLKKIANTVTDTNDKSGVGKALKNIFNL